MSSQVPGDTEDLRDRSLGELLKQLSEQTTRLVHQELELAKAELAQKGRQAGMGAGMFGGAGALGLAAVGALTACFILALNADRPAAGPARPPPPAAPGPPPATARRTMTRPGHPPTAASAPSHRPPSGRIIP